MKHKSFLEIFSVIIGVINKIAGVRFVYRPNWTIQIEVLLQFYHNHYNFREKQLHFVFVKELLIPIIQNYGKYQRDIV